MKRILHLIIPFFLFTLITLSGNSLLAQGWERTFGGNAEDNAYSVIQTLDGGYALLGFSESTSSVGTNVILIKTDEQGQEQWTQSFGGTGDDKGYEVVQAADGTYGIIGQTSSMGSGGDDVLLIKTDPTGNQLWRKSYGGSYTDKGFSLTLAKDGGYIFVGRTDLIGDNKANVYLIKTDGNGNLLWERNFGGPDIDVGQSVIETAGGDIIIVGETRSFATPNPNSPTAPSADVYFIKTNAIGEVLVEKSYGNLEQDIAFDVVETKEGNFALTGVTTNQEDVYLLMLDNVGNELWSKSYGGIFGDVGYSLALTEDNGFIIAGVKEITATHSQVYLLKTDNQGIIEWERLFGSLGSDVGRSVVTTADGGYIVAGNFDVNNNPNNSSLIPLYDMYLIKTNPQGNVFPNVIKGTVHRDKNTNCEKDEDEKVLEDWLIRLKKGDDIVYATTNKNGEYSVTVENGSYNVGVIIRNTAWEVCQNYNVVFTDNDTMQLDFAVRATVENCPVLEVDVSTAVLEPCRAANYVINICNRGIVTSEDTYIDVQFDPYLVVNFSTLPWSNHVGNIYRFDIGDLLVEECGSFEVSTTLSCEAIIGQAHCVEAYAHPDPICIPPPPLWDGASIRVDGECIGDSVQFIIKNVGDGDMIAPLGFIVIEDDVAFRVGAPFQLPSGRSDTFYIEATASTYRVIAKQPPGHPYGSTASAAVEGCPFGQPFNTGFLTAFGDSDALPFYSVDCQENKNITGIADITPSPKGVGTAHHITNTDDLEYHIYFQNTGSDTVNQVVIRDTLSADFDISSLVVGASSHPYDFEVSGTGVLKLIFKNINLLSTAQSVTKSHGFVKFHISQKKDNPTGMVIENQASILFDFGAPILSNLTFHTVGGEIIEDFVAISTDVEEIYTPNLEVKIMPNPFNATNGTTIELIGLEGIIDIQFDLFDVAGRSVQSKRYNSSKFQFYPAKLPQGLYIYTIRTEGGLVNSGKVFIK